MSDKKPHILILPRWYPNENDVQLGTFIKEQAILMADLYDISVIYVKHTNTISNRFETEVNQSNGITEIIVRFKTFAFLKQIRHYLSYKKAQVIGYKLLKEPADICHVHVPIRPTFLAQKLKKTQNIPYIITEHWSGHLNGLFKAKSTLYKHYYRRALRHASQITTVSQFLQRKFKSNTGFDSKVIPNYIQNINSDDKVTETPHNVEILSVSDIVDSTKNISGLIHAFHKAYQINNKLRLTLIGDGPDMHKIKTLIARLKLDKIIQLLGRFPHAEVLKSIPSYDFYICNSNFESFGMTVAEAIFAGKPVICSKCGGPEEFVNTKNGILVDTNDPSLSESILKMADSYSSYNPAAIAEAIETKFGKAVVKQKWKARLRYYLTRIVLPIRNVSVGFILFNLHNLETVVWFRLAM